MAFFADTHVHIYPCYDLGRVVEGVQASLSAFGRSVSAEYGLFLAERRDCDFYRQLYDRGSAMLPEGFSVDFMERGLSACISRDCKRFWIFPGRQIVSREKIELLSLLSGVDIPEGEPLRESIVRVIDGGGVPVLCWAPGKWTFERGRVVREMLEDLSLHPLFLGDSMLRFWPLPEPSLFKFGRQCGRRILAGSDPLPFCGEEDVVGRYAVFIEEDLDEQAPCAALREILRRSSGQFRILGSRSCLCKAVNRFVQNEMQRRGCFS